MGSPAAEPHQSRGLAKGRAPGGGLSLGTGSAVAGFVTLAAITSILFVYSSIETVRHFVPLALLMVLVLVGLAAQLRIEWLTLRKQTAIAHPFTADSGYDAAAVFTATLITYGISVPLGQGAVVASAMVGILAALLVPRRAVPAYCGSFAGMISNQLVNGWNCVALAGAIAAVVFVLAKPTLNGFGGKLGTIAFTGCVLSALVRGERLLTGSVPTTSTGLWIVGYSIVAAVVTYSISVRLKHGPVMASGAVGLIGGLLLPVVHPEIGGLLAIAVFCASFAGMSAAARFANEWYMVTAGLFCGLVLVYTAPHMGGAGGKLGTIAFGSTIAVSGLRDGLRFLRAHGVQTLVARGQPTPR